MTPSLFEIPLIAAPQSFLIMLGNQQYQLTLRYRDAVEAGWTLDISKASGQPIVCGIPLVTGVDLLEPYPDLGLGGQLWVQTDAQPDAVPGFDDLGHSSHLYFVPKS